MARIDGMAAIVAEDEPLTGWDPDGAEVILIPILSIGFVNAVAAEAGRQEVSVAGQLVFPDVFVVEGDINDIVVWRNGIRPFGVVDDGAAMFPVYLIDVDQVKVFVRVGIVDI
jgi:hypothetical protein